MRRERPAWAHRAPGLTRWEARCRPCGAGEQQKPGSNRGPGDGPLPALKARNASPDQKPAAFPYPLPPTLMRAWRAGVRRWPSRTGQRTFNKTNQGFAKSYNCHLSDEKKKKVFEGELKKIIWGDHPLIRWVSSRQICFYLIENWSVSEEQASDWQI